MVLPVVQFIFHLLELLIYLVPYLFPPIPVKSNGSDLVLDPVSFDHGGERYRNAGKYTAVSFLHLQFLPVFKNLPSVFYFRLPKYMRMPED